MVYSNNMKIKVEIEINAAVEKVWEYWNTPDYITQWCFALDDWECPSVSVDLKVGGKQNTRMQAKDGSFGFDFSSTFLKIEGHKYIEYIIDGEDKRVVQITFEKINDTKTKVIEIFDGENINPAEMQKAGWQSILENFKKCVENN